MIIQISGKLRQGKGVFMVLYCLALASMGYRILANFTIKHPNARKIDFYQFLNLLRQPAPQKPTIIAIDELPTWIDSYCTTSSKSNRMASHFCNQSAKLGYEMIYTAQRTRRADINYREMVNQSYQAEKQNLCAARKCPNNCPNLAKCRYVYHILDPNFIDEDIDTGRSIKIPFSAARYWWNLYDTFEPVVPLGLDEFFFELEKTDPKRLLSVVNRQAQLLREKGMHGRYTISQIKLALMDCGELPFFAEYVAVRLGQPKPC